MADDIVVRSDKNGGKVHLSADRLYDLNRDETQDALNIKQYISLAVTVTQNGTGTKSITGMTADHVLDSIQFYSDSAFTTATGTTPADISWTTGAGSVSVTVANKGTGTFYMILCFAYKPIQETLTI